MIETDAIDLQFRRKLLNYILTFLFAILFFRLFQLQLMYHKEFGKQSEENSVRVMAKDPVRGYIFDRNGKLVVDVAPSYSITITPAFFDTSKLGFLSSILNISSDEIRKRVQKGLAYSRFSPVRIVRDVNFKTLSAVEENIYQLSGVSYEVDFKRSYPTGVRASHLLGYCKEITEAQLAKYGDIYQLGDIIGSAGLEASYENFLRGEKGYQFISVNSKGQVIGPFEGGTKDTPPKEGFDLILSVDFELQAFAESVMTNYRGALVAIDPNDGGILAMVSKPDFDPSLLSGITSAEDWKKLSNHPDKPLFNRATMTRYPPGSTFKMVVAIAALEEGIINENYYITCKGAFKFGDKVFLDNHVHGTVNIVKAIQQSCNVFFYQLALKVGLDKLYEYGKRLGFGLPTNVDLNEETPGLIPSKEYYDRVYGKGKWTQGFLVSLGVGQGEIGVSPLQMARYVATIANGGTLHQPHLVHAIRNKRTNRVEIIDHQEFPTWISEKTLRLVREGMRRVVEEPGGTGRLAKIQGIVSAGKTGTAENPHGPTHAWYVGFAPFDQPKIAVAVLLENAGAGGAKAAPIAGLVIEKYLFGEIKRKMQIVASKPDSNRAGNQIMQGD